MEMNEIPRVHLVGDVLQGHYFGYMLYVYILLERNVATVFVLVILAH